MAKDKTADENPMGGVMGGILGIVMVMVVLGLVTGFTPKVTYYTCPIDGLQFTSLAELETHFATEHPAIDIDIIWE